MKVIYPSLMTSAIADYENSDYPAVNVEDDHPKKVWRSTISTGRMYCGTTSGSNAIGIFGTNATSIDVSVSDGIAVTWNSDGSYETPTWNADASYVEVSWVTATELEDVGTLTPNDIGSAWADYTTINYAHLVELNFTAATGTKVEVGVVKVGAVKQYTDPAYPVRQGFHDFSIVKELNNGAIYVRKRDIVRTFDLQIREDRDPDWYEFMHDLTRSNGPGPMAWRLSDNVADWEFVVFARFRNQLPTGMLDTPDLGTISFSLIEVY